MRRGGTLPLYVGGFIGPFGGGVVTVLVPQLREAFDASTAAVAAMVPAYLLPFALLQLVSGTIGERLGRRRVVRAGYVTYAVASLLAVVVGDLGAFLGLRALQGCANAFLTPLLLAGLADEVPQRTLGRAVGTFAAVQTAAVALAPLGGGVLGALDWRLAFVAPAVISVALALIPPADARRRAADATLRAAFTPRVGLLSAAAFAGYGAVTGTSFLVVVLAADEFGLGSVARGVLLAGFGVGGFLAGRAAGSAVDRFGRVPVATVGIAICALLLGLLAVAPSVGVLGATWFAIGLGSSLMMTAINTLAIEAVPANRAGGTSVVSAFRFAGSAVAPLLLLPLYHADPRLGFLSAAAITACAAAFVAPLRVQR